MSTDLLRLPTKDAESIAYARGDKVLAELFARILDLEEENADLQTVADEFEKESINLRLEVSDLRDERDTLTETLVLLQDSLDKLTPTRTDEANRSDLLYNLLSY